MKTPQNSRKMIFGLAFLGVTTTVSAAESLFDVGVGARSERFHWSISGNFDGTSPNILSELIWDEVNIVEIFFNTDTRTNNGIRVQTHLAYGSIEDGRVRDSDYLASERNAEFSRSLSASEGDSTLDVSISVGYELPVTDAQATKLTPFVGISMRESDFEITQGFQALDVFGGTGGASFGGLNSTYDTEWESAFLGLQLDHMHGRWHVFGRYEYHDFTYKAKANWNLRSDFAHPVSFIHDSDGSGPLYAVGARRSITADWDLFMNYSWWNWDADNGSDTTFFSDGTSSRTRLKTAVSDGNTFFLGVSYTPGQKEQKLAKN
ncbi:MAG: hypothetical protein ACI8P9_004651 [Parasphingorhabdus sp.]|jgi:hypothetical protein